MKANLVPAFLLLLDLHSLVWGVGLQTPRFRPRSLVNDPQAVSHDLLSQCDEHYRTVALDHFSWVDFRS